MRCLRTFCSLFWKEEQRRWLHKAFFSSPLEQAAVSPLQLKYIFGGERSWGLQLTGVDWKCFLCPAKNVSVMEYCGGKRVTLVYLENEPEKVSGRQSRE